MKKIIVCIYNIPDETMVIDSIFKLLKEIGVCILTVRYANTEFSFITEPGENIDGIIENIEIGINEISNHFKINLEYDIEDIDVNYNEFISIESNVSNNVNLINGILLIPTNYKGSIDQYDSVNTLKINEGVAFGSCTHSSGMALIHLMKTYITENCSMLDFGAGNGILSLVATLYGTTNISCCDIDPSSEASIKENANINNIDISNFKFLKSLNESIDTYDIIVSNITAYSVIPLIDKLELLLKDSGKLLLSGVFVNNIKKVKTELERHFKIIDILHVDNWTAFVCEKL